MQPRSLAPASVPERARRCSNPSTEPPPAYDYCDAARTFSLPAVSRWTNRDRVRRVAWSRAGAVDRRQRLAPRLEILERRGPEQWRVSRQIAPSALVEEPGRERRIGFLDVLLVLEGVEQLAARHGFEIPDRNLRDAGRRASRYRCCGIGRGD